ncbi:cytochrome P450 [Byssothecium circinans]|uniref:Cytochrome P450 n=1 Tax=Byssothecium circinans TaxID=147558 RepID=A0A6A5UE33_9PLEO|nr:cytochrome P450 [Byssothecium circinans]
MNSTIAETQGTALEYFLRSPIVAVIVLFLAIVGGKFVLGLGQREALLPPGPPTLPIIGNANIFPRSYLHHKFAEWSKQYGDVVSVKVMNQTIIALHSPAAVKEVFDKHGASNTNRPKSTIVEIITPDNLNLGTGRYANETWKLMRKASQALLNSRNLEKFTKVQHAEATQMIVDLIHTPENWMEHCQRFTTSFFLSVVYGTRGPQSSTPAVRDFLHAHRRFMRALNFGTAPPVDLFPILKLVPKRFAGWKREAEAVKGLHDELYSRLTKQVRERLRKGRGNGCFMEDALQNDEAWGMKDEVWLNNLGGTILEGSDTTSASIQNVIVCAVAFPDKQRLVSEELERVVGPNRVPRLEDLNNLPYTRAFINESMRFVPVAPIGVPHEMNRDEMINGMLFPKGAVLFMNTWFMFHDERYFDRPEEFLPERFLDNPFGVKPEAADDPARRDTFLFGGGRRICPGSASATTSMETISPYLLWAFDFKQALDPETGKEVSPKLEFESGIVAIPSQIKCLIVPKSKDRIQVIQQEFQRVAEELKRYEVEISEEDMQYNRKYRDTVSITI